MTSEKSNETVDTDAPAGSEEPVCEGDTGESAEAVVDEAEAPEVQVEDALAAAQEELAVAKDAALRAQAEAENVRRRAARDVENAHKYALDRFANDLLPVVDNLERAVESAEAVVGEHEAAEAIAEGVKLSLKLFLDTLEKAGIEQLSPEGEPFDPAFHEAMSLVENPDVEPNTVLHVVQKGYTLNGRLIRAAMVMVSKVPGT